MNNDVKNLIARLIDERKINGNEAILLINSIRKPEYSISWENPDVDKAVKPWTPEYPTHYGWDNIWHTTNKAKDDERLGTSKATY